MHINLMKIFIQDIEISTHDDYLRNLFKKKTQSLTKRQAEPLFEVRPFYFPKMTNTTSSPSRIIPPELPPVEAFSYSSSASSVTYVLAAQAALTARRWCLKHQQPDLAN